MQIRNHDVCDASKGSPSNKRPLVGKHAFSLRFSSRYILVAAMGFDTFYVCSSLGIILLSCAFCIFAELNMSNKCFISEFDPFTQNENG